MSETDHDLQLLQNLLDVIPPEYDPMCVAQLDGYFVALIVCPDMIPPSEWLPVIWGEDYAFADAAEAEGTVAAVMMLYNRIAGELADRPEEYAPVLEIDPGTNEPLWELWIDGFERAMRLRPDVWEEIALSDDEEASASISMIVALSRNPRRQVGVDGGGRGRSRPAGARADSAIGGQPERVDEVPARRATRQGPRRLRSHRSAGVRPQGGS